MDVENIAEIDFDSIDTDRFIEEPEADCETP